MLVKIKAAISNVLKVVITFVLSVLVLLTFANVVTRNVFNFSILWADELSRALFVWAIFLGITYAVLESSLMTITALTDKLRKHNLGIVVDIAYWIAALIFFGVLAVYGIQYAISCHSGVSAMLHIRLSMIAAAIPYCGIVSTLFVILNIAIYFQNKDGQEVKK